MTFMHVAQFVWNDGSDAVSVGAEVREALEGYVAQIDGVESYWCGPDAGFTSGNADFVVVGRFASRDAFVAYRDDPRHRAISSDVIGPHLESRSTVQLED
ncbi:MAG TPA: Dabb family protein [Candidatus Nanopelagicales bacterium]|nr:Dabb family protein [Candidatus Nanopelagicales bacterium]